MIMLSGQPHSVWFTKDGLFKCDPTPKKRGFPKSEHYITIELGVRDMPPEQQRTSLHKRITFFYYAITFNGIN